MRTTIVVVASYFIAIPLSVVLYEFFCLDWHHRRQLGLLLVTGGLISLLLAKGGSVLVHDPRPFMAGHFMPLIVSTRDNGFPSDHTLLAAFIGYAMLNRSRWLGGILLAVAAAVGTARVAAGVHHLQDILGSFVIAGIGYLLAHWIISFISRQRSKHV